MKRKKLVKKQKKQIRDLMESLVLCANDFVTCDERLQCAEKQLSEVIGDFVNEQKKTTQLETAIGKAVKRMLVAEKELAQLLHDKGAA